MLIVENKNVISDAIQLVNYCTKELENAGVKNSLYICEYLLTEILNCKPYQLYTERFKLSSKNFRKLKNWLSKIQHREPVQYVTNHAYFMDFEFYIDSRSFIPRPETELLVEQVIKMYKGSNRIAKGLDLGTGCGNIAISIVKYLPNVYMTATDVSRQSLEVAKINVDKHDVSDRVVLKPGSVFKPISEKIGEFDFIVSNPPYVPTKAIKNGLSPQVDHEPKIALNGGSDGLDFYRKIIKEADKFLIPEGFMFLEIGNVQAGPVYKYIDKNNNLNFDRFILDYNNIKRILVVRKCN